MDQVIGPEAVADELRRERDGFFEAIGAIATESLTTPGLVGEWSARELIAHLGYWVGHATETIHAVEQGRSLEMEGTVDEINETVARVARSTGLTTVRRRETASVEALVERLRTLDPDLLAVVLPDGETVLQAIRDDGADHYREHADDLRASLREPAHG